MRETDCAARSVRVQTRAGRRAAAEALLDGGADVHARNFEGETALHIAADHGHDGVVNLLLLRGHQVDLRGTDGATALHRTSQRGHVKCIARLLKGARPVERVRRASSLPHTGLAAATARPSSAGVDPLLSPSRARLLAHTQPSPRRCRHQLRLQEEHAAAVGGHLPSREGGGAAA